MTGTAFEPGLLGRACWLELADGNRIELPVHRWRAPVDPGDELLLGRCTGPTLDAGCGPGRLTAALAERGVPALGVDTSPVAVALTRRRGGTAIRGDVFDPVPAERTWQHVLLADGNIGIGGDPVRLLRRTAELLRDGGSVLVEVDAPGTGLRRDRARVSTTGQGGPWFDWAWLGTDAVSRTADAAGLTVGWLGVEGRRWFAELVRA